MPRKRSGCWSAMIQLAIIACVSLSATAGVVAWMAASEGTSLTEVVSALLKGRPAARPALARPTASAPSAASEAKPSPTPVAEANFTPPPLSAQPSLGTPAGAATSSPEPITASPTPAGMTPAVPVSPAPAAGPPSGAQTEGAGLESPIRSGSALPERQATRLVIQALGLDVPVVLSPIVSRTWQVSQLGKDFVGHLEGTASPGDPSNVVLAGHVTLEHNVYGPFAALGSLQSGDEIIVYVANQPYTYIVDNLRMVNRTDVQVAYPTQTARLTLITWVDWSNELKAYQKRLIVIGHLAQ